MNVDRPAQPVEPKNPTVHVVISKYNEDISWCDSIPYTKIIYDKLEEPTTAAYIHRPNIVREAETWLFHIITHYENLPDFLVFLQGDPFGHLSYKTHHGINHYIDKYVSNFDKNKPQWGDLQLLYRFGWHEEPIHCYPMLRIDDQYSTLFSSPVPERIGFASGAQYIVPKSLILCRSKTFYKKVHDMILKEFATVWTNVKYAPDKIDAWSLERLWPYIWDPLVQVNEPNRAEGPDARERDSAIDS